MNLKYEVGQTVKVEANKTVVELMESEIKSITVCSTGAKYLTSKGAFSEEQLDAFALKAQPIAPQEDKAKFKSGDKVKVIDDGRAYSNYNDWFSQNPILSQMSSRYSCRIKDGDVCEVVAIAPHLTDKNRTLCAIETADGKIGLINETGLEPYAEPEKEPEPVYYNGKVVCVDRGGSRCFTQYKGYEFKNGIVIDDDGDEYNSPCKTLHDFNNRSLPQFIPYLGEA